MPAFLQRKSVKPVGLALALTLILSGCAELPSDAPITKVDYRVCLLSDKDPAGPGVSALADYAIGQAVVTYGVKSSQITTTAAKFKTDLKSLVKQGCDLVTIVGTSLESQVSAAVQGFTKINFVFVTDHQNTETSRQNFSNLLVIQLNLFESGLILGYLGASLSQNHWVAMTQVLPDESEYTAGVRSGVSRFAVDQNQPTVFSKELGVASDLSTSNPDVFIDSIDNSSLDLSSYSFDRFLILGFGVDLYQQPKLEEYKSHIATSLLPGIGDALMATIGSDLEGDFVGGESAIIKLGYSQQGLTLAPEHDVNIPQRTLDDIARLASEYETKN